MKHAAQNCINSKQIIRYQDALAAAINADFSSRSLDESKLLDLLGSVLEADHAIHHLRRWMRPSKRRTELLFLSNRFVQYQPKGVVGVIVPWNFPVYLALGPLIAALAAGNRVMIKLPEITPIPMPCYDACLSKFSMKMKWRFW